MTWSALTNAFAQSLFVASLALVVGLPVERANRRTILMLTIVAASALLTHPSTCAILVGVLAATSALYAWRGGDLRTAAIGVAVAIASAAAIAVALYYAWFPSVYVSELGRVASRASRPRRRPRRPRHSAPDWRTPSGSSKCISDGRRLPQRQSAHGVSPHRPIAAPDAVAGCMGWHLSRFPRRGHRDADRDALSLRRVPSAGDCRRVRMQLGLAKPHGRSSRDVSACRRRGMGWNRTVAVGDDHVCPARPVICASLVPSLE